MEPTNPDSPTRSIFPAWTSEPTALVDLRSDIWAVLQLMAAGGCPLENMRLIRWQGMRELMGKRWIEVGQNIETALRQELESRLAPGEFCIRYDDFSLLLISDGSSPSTLDNLESDIVPEIDATLAGAMNDGRLLEPLRRSWHELAEGEGANGESKSSSGDPTSPQVSLSA